MDGFLLVFDLTDRHSFHIVESILHDLSGRKGREGSLSCVLVGNKVDLYSAGGESQEDKEMMEINFLGERLAERRGVTYVKSSAKADSSVKDAFVLLIKKVMKRRHLRTIVSYGTWVEI